MSVDVIMAMIDALKADSTVATLTQGRIRDNELTTDDDGIMPVYALVVRYGGGPAGPKTIQLSDRRFTVLCYGETPHLADVLYEEVYRVLKNLGPSVWTGTYIHWCNASSGPITMRDPDTQWPYTTSSWETRASDLVAA